MAKVMKPKITVSGKKIAAYLKAMQEDEQRALFEVAGVAEKYVQKVTDFGSALIFGGTFGARDPFGDGSILESQKMILPVDIAVSLQKCIDKVQAGPVRFRADVSIKKSSKSAQGYFLKINWTHGPEHVGQMDLVRDLLKKTEPPTLIPVAIDSDGFA
jgi:hypothetical protein